MIKLITASSLPLTRIEGDNMLPKVENVKILLIKVHLIWWDHRSLWRPQKANTTNPFHRHFINKIVHTLATGHGSVGRLHTTLTRRSNQFIMQAEKNNNNQLFLKGIMNNTNTTVNIILLFSFKIAQAISLLVLYITASIKERKYVLFWLCCQGCVPSHTIEIGLIPYLGHNLIHPS